MFSNYVANMRCHFNDKDDETNFDQNGINIWTSSSLQNPSVLKCVDNLNGAESKSYSGDLSTLYSLDSSSQSYKRKILECETEDFEERFSKLQKKRQMLRATARANLVVDDVDDFDEESEIYEQMKWIENESSGMTLHLWKDSNVDLSFQSISSRSPIMYIPKLNWREERRHLLRISMAKIRGVDDPESYLRRSVLINNTVRRLQKDFTINCKCQSVASSSLFQGSNIYQNDSSSWDLESSPNDEDVCKDYMSETKEFCNSRSVCSHSSTSYACSELSSLPYNLQLSLFSPLSSDKPVDSYQNEVLQNSIIFSRYSQDDHIVCDPSFSYRTLKQTSPVHMFSSQPCGLQYRNSTYENCNNEYHESSNSSSILDSVVYHSLIASLET